MRVAKAIVSLYHNGRLAAKAEEEFIATLQKGSTPTAMLTIAAATGELLSAALLRAGSVTSKAEFRRLISAGAIGEVSGPAITDPYFIVERPLALKIGKRRFLHIIL